MDTTYRLVIIGRHRALTSRYGMYTYGDTAATPELARLVPGSIDRLRDGERYGIERCEWVPNRYGEMSVARKVLIDAEVTPGEWGILSHAPLA